MVRQAVKVGGIHGIALTKLDVLDGLPELKICTGYRIDGELHAPPAGRAARRRPRRPPDYETIEGWSGSHPRRALAGRDLPAQAIKYVRRIEELVEAPVTLLSHQPGARRHDPGAGPVRGVGRNSAAYSAERRRNTLRYSALRRDSARTFRAIPTKCDRAG